jgi:hypothetical protein
VTEPLSRRIAELADLWSIPEIATTEAIHFSPRLKRSLGRADMASGRVALGAFLVDQPAPRTVPSSIPVGAVIVPPAGAAQPLHSRPFAD